MEMAGVKNRLMNLGLVAPCLLAAGILQGCGLAETTVAAGAAGGAAGQQAQQARQTMEDVRTDVAAAEETAAKARAAAEEASR
jgi:hypothetical protein